MVVVQIDNTDNIGIFIQLKLPLRNGSPHRILGSENLVEFLKLSHALVVIQHWKTQVRLTVRFLVSGMRK